MWYWRKDGEDRLEVSCEKWESVTKNQGEKEHPAYNRTKEG
jgi:hypothetical protein